MDKRRLLEEGIQVDVLTTHTESVADDDPLIKLQLAMATSSINHEYALMEYEDSLDIQRRDELLSYMDQCRDRYIQARQTLKSCDPIILETFERDLKFQKQSALKGFNA